MTVVALLVLGFLVGLPVGRRLPRRGRHASPRTRWSRQRWEAITAARLTHPTAHDENVVIDLRAWLPADRIGAIDATALRTALLGRRPTT